VKLLDSAWDGVAPLVAAIKKARKSVDIVIFRFDRAERRGRAEGGFKRGVSVSALITYTNHGGEKSLQTRNACWTPASRCRGRPTISSATTTSCSSWTGASSTSCPSISPT
jgi:hypothetical protein